MALRPYLPVPPPGLPLEGGGTHWLDLTPCSKSHKDSITWLCFYSSLAVRTSTKLANPPGVNDQFLQDSAEALRHLGQVAIEFLDLDLTIPVVIRFTGQSLQKVIYEDAVHEFVQFDGQDLSAGCAECQGRSWGDRAFALLGRRHIVGGLLRAPIELPAHHPIPPRGGSGLVAAGGQTTHSQAQAVWRQGHCAELALRTQPDMTSQYALGAPGASVPDPDGLVV